MNPPPLASPGTKLRLLGLTAGLVSALVGLSCKEDRSAREAGNRALGEPAPRTAAIGEAPADRAPALNLACGKDSALKLYDDTSDGDGYIKHKLMDGIRSEAGYFVARTFYEGGDWLFVSKRYCNTLDLFGPVFFNPSKSIFASISGDNGAGYGANGVQMVSVSLRNGLVSLDLQDRMERYGGDSGTWVDDSTLVMEVKDMEGAAKKRRYELRDGTWQIRNE